MTENENLLPVSDTAALVMLWASDYYDTKHLIDTYLMKLDLAAGQQLLERYNSICPWYSEVIINRKHFIKNMVEELIRGDAKRTIIVNLGAGFSPLALELSPLLNDRVSFIEIDRTNMGHKLQHYSELVPETCRFISCIESDIADTVSLIDTLKREMVDPVHTKLIVVMEGLSYYIDRPVMEQVFASLSGLVPDMNIIFEHLKPCRLISEERRFIPYRIFSHVRDYTGLKLMTTYSKDEIRSMLASGFSFRYYDMNEMERMRTGSCRYFTTPEAGWLSCAVAVRRPFNE